MYLTRILGISRAGGYGTLPFDLCITTFDSIRACIETDFSEFFKDLRLIPGNNPYGDRSKAGPGLQSITNAYGMEFNHEGPSHSHLFAEGTNDDEFYVRNDFEKFRERYLRRIEISANYWLRMITSQLWRNTHNLIKKKYCKYSVQHIQQNHSD